MKTDTITSTTLQVRPTGVIIARLIDHKYYIIEFDIAVEARFLAQYFNMRDEKFMRFGRISLQSS